MTTDFSQLSDKQLKEHLATAGRMIAVEQARSDMLRFVQLMMPDVEDPDDAEKSSYVVTPQGRMLCEMIEKMHKGSLKRTAVSMPPQHGKSLILAWAGPAWLLGQNPKLNVIVATYNHDRAMELGSDFRQLIRSTPYQQVFPNVQLDQAEQSKAYMKATAGGKLVFAGAGTSITGKPADIVIIDDPIKGPEEANSEDFREKQWTWFFSVMRSRMNKNSRALIVHTRWSEDDMIGRLCDPDHPERNDRFKGVADRWTFYNLPAVVTDPEMAKALGLELEPPLDPEVVKAFGFKPMSALWPERFDLEHHAEWKLGDERSFNALAMGKPAPDDGEYFKADWLVEYHKPGDLPENLTYYGASDHAVSEKQDRDFTVMGCVGVDENDDIWVLPDVVWERMQTDRTVEELLHQFKAHKPALWWMESELISKSFGPFLRKRMREERTYATIDPVTVSKDKKTRGRAIQGRMAMQKVHFPAFAPWWGSAKQQLLQFPYGANDDFVDWLAHIGMGLEKEVTPSRPAANENGPASGSIRWIMQSSLKRARREQRAMGAKGW